MAILSRILPKQWIFPRGPTWRLLLVGSVVLFVCFGVAGQERPTDYQVKAAFLEKFGKFVEWPGDTFSSTNAPVVIGVYGEDPFDGALQGLAATDMINGRPVEIRRVKTVAEAKACHVIFIPASAKMPHEVLNALAGAPVLTVGETDDFYNSGGMIEFVIENTQVHFKIKNEAARAAGLRISSKLLILSKRP